MPEKLLTLITAPKPFTDPHIAVIQTNALKSWLALGEQVDVIVLGDDEGVARATAEMGFLHIADVACNELGTPLISSMLNRARQASASPFLCIVNTDILLFPDLLDAMHAAARRLNKFLLLGQRWDMDVREDLGPGSRQFAEFKQRVMRQGILHPPMGSDYFLFPRDCYTHIPDFAIGRAGWDNWFIFKSRWEGWPVIDATRDVTIVHQAHDYRHLPGGQPHYRLPETKVNVLLGGGEQTIFTMVDAQFDLVGGKIKKKRLTPKKILREIEISPLTRLKSMAVGRLFFYFFHPRKALQALRGWVMGSRG